jgi:hypothetical protein
MELVSLLTKEASIEFPRLPQSLTGQWSQTFSIPPPGASTCRPINYYRSSATNCVSSTRRA